MRVERRQIISSKSTKIVKIFLRNKKLLLDRNFLFELLINKIYIYLINTNFNFIIIRNNRILSLIISYYYRINSIIKYEAKEEYSINVENYSLATKINSIKNLIIANFINLLNLKSIIKKIEVDSSLKIKLSNKIIIYDKSKYVEIIRRISKKNLRIQKNSKDTINLSKLK